MRFAWLLILGLLINTAQAATTLVIQSDADDVLGQGNSYTTTELLTLGLTGNVLFRDENFLFNFSSPPDEKSLSVKAYRQTTDQSLINIAKNDNYCYQEPTGEFFIYDLDWNHPEGKIALDFVYYCGTDSGALRGSLRVNSDIPIPYTGPRANITAPTLAHEGGQITLKSGDSFSANDEITGYQWEQVSGTQATLSATDQEDIQANLPQGMKLGGENLTFRLTVTDTNGQSHSTTHNVKVASKSDPQSYFEIQSSSSGPHGLTQSWSFNSSNSQIEANSSYYGDDIQITINQENAYWRAEFAAPVINGRNTQLEEGIYPYAEHVYYQSDSVAGLHVSSGGPSDCTAISGSFDISRLRRNQNGELKEFKASFDQSCQSNSLLLSGTVAFNAKHESVPEASAGETIEVAENSIVNLDGSGSFDPLGTLQSYQWQSVENEFVINNATQSRAYFFSPVMADRESQRLLAFRLLITDDEGYQSEDWVNVRVISANQAPIAMNDAVTLPDGTTTIFISPLDNDLDDDGRIPADSISIIQQPANGHVIIHSDGKLEYTASGTTRSDSFSYTIKDNDGAISAPAFISVNGGNVTGVTVKLRAFLQGAYDPATGMMRDDLRQANLLPTQQPFADTTLAYTGKEVMATSLLNRKDETAPVDWVMIKLHAIGTEEKLAHKAAILLRNGLIVDALNPDSPLRFTGLENGNYYITLSHRNHLKASTTAAVPLTDSPNPALIDFTVAHTDYPPLAAHALWEYGGIRGLWAGDTDMNQRVVANGPGNDTINIIGHVLSDTNNPQFAGNYIAKGYYAADLNLDGNIIYAGPDNDNNLLLENILSHPDNQAYTANYVIISAP